MPTPLPPAPRHSRCSTLTSAETVHDVPAMLDTVMVSADELFVIFALEGKV